MKYGFGAVMLTLMGITLSSNTMAACGQITTQCLVFRNGAESTESCEITLCANTNDSRVIKVDSQEGISMPASILKDNLTCYATRDVSIIYCAKDVWL